MPPAEGSFPFVGCPVRGRWWRGRPGSGSVRPGLPPRWASINAGLVFGLDAKLRAAVDLSVAFGFGDLLH